MSAPGEPAGHRDYEGMAVAHVLGGLDEERGRVFRAHLLECSDCRARVGELRAIASDLAGVERSARREEQEEEASAALDTKRRDDPAPAEQSSPPARWPMVAVVGLLAAVIGLSMYIFVLRAQITGLEQEVADRATAAAVLEHGNDAPLTFEATDVVATVRTDRGDIAVVVDGLADDETYQATLLNSEAGTSQTMPAAVDDGRLLLLIERRPGDDGLRIERADGETIAEADLTGR